MAKGKAAYLVLFFTSVLFASTLRSFGDGIMKSYLHVLSHGCANYDSINCLGNEAVYRVSFTLCSFFSLMTVLTLVSENEFHSGGWCLKFPLYLCFFAATLFFSNDTFITYVFVAKISSAFFILLQIVGLIDMAYEVHEYLALKIVQSEENNKLKERLLNNPRQTSLWSSSTVSSITCWQGLYLAIGFGAIGLSGAGLLTMFYNYAHCTLAVTCVSITAAACVILTLLSVTPWLNVGLLVPSIVSLYLTYLCYDALSSFPDTLNDTTTTSTITTTTTPTSGVLLAALSLTWTSWRLSTCTQSLFTLTPANTVCKDESEEEEDIGMLLNTSTSRGRPQTRYVSPCWHFHFIMTLGALYMTMALTGWGDESQTADPSRQSRQSSLMSMWVKIASQWLTIVLYGWTLLAPYLCPSRVF